MRNVKGSLLSASLAAVLAAVSGPAVAQAPAQTQAPAHNMATMKMSPVTGPNVKVTDPTSVVMIVDRDSNAVWGMQFVWPVKADYRIMYVDDNYSQTMIGRERRDYIWIMARTPLIPEADYQRLVAFAGRQGYEVALIQKMPQQWK